MTAAPTVTGKGIRRGRRGQRGVTYLIVLFLVALVGMGLAALGTVWQTEMQRERERELLFIGEQFANALWRYYDSSPEPKTYPRRLEDLLEDRRHQVPRRHLRQIFVDPMTGRRDWVLIVVGGQITAVRSRSTATTIVHAGFPPGWEELAGAKTHAEWLFTPLAPRAGTTAPAATAAAPDAAATDAAQGSAATAVQASAPAQRGGFPSGKAFAQPVGN